MSDHFPCFVSYEATTPVNNKDSLVFERHKVNEEAMLRFQQHLLFYDWDPINDMDVNQSYKYLIDVITEGMDIHAPKHLVKISPDERFREPWMTTSIKKCNQRCLKLCNKDRVSSEYVTIVEHCKWASQED